MKIKNFIKENYKFIILMILIVLFFNVKLPYYIMAPGGTINITDRVVKDNYNKKSKGSLNMLYVSEYEGTPASLLLAKLKSYDIESNKERQISNESVKEINRRNTIQFSVELIHYIIQTSIEFIDDLFFSTICNSLLKTLHIDIRYFVRDLF